MKPLKCSDCYCQVNGEKCQYGYEGEPHITIFNYQDGQQSTKDCPACSTMEQFQNLIEKKSSELHYDIHNCDGVWICDGVVYRNAKLDFCKGCWALRQSWCVLGFDNQCRNRMGTLTIPLVPCPKPLNENEFFVCYQILKIMNKE